MTQAIDSLEQMEDADDYDSMSWVQGGTPLCAPEILQPSKSSDTTFLEFALGSKRSYLWVIERGAIKSHVLPARGQIENTIKRWRELVTARERASGAGLTAACMDLRPYGCGTSKHHNRFGIT
jgi:hypothetical protein